MKTWKFNLAVLLMVLALAENDSYSQDLIWGRIVDESDTPVAYVNVLLYTQTDSSFIAAEVSNEEGEFKLDFYPDNPSYLEFSYVGFDRKRYAVASPGDVGIVRLAASSVILEDITVRAKRPLVTREKDKLIVNVEGNILAEGNDVLELLSKSPGIIVDYNDMFSLNGRTGVRIQIDGRDTRLQGNGLAGLLKSMSAANIDRIEIITNPSARYEAQGNAGIINIITHQSRFYGTNGRVELSPGYGRYFRWQNALNLNHRNSWLNAYGNYSYGNRDQYMEIVQNRKYTDGNSRDGYLEIQNDFVLPIKTHNVMTGVDIDLGQSYRLNVQWTTNIRKDGSEVENEILDFSNEDFLLSRQNTVTDVNSEWKQHIGGLALEKNFADKSKLELKLDGAQYSNGSEEVYNSSFSNSAGVLEYTDILDGMVTGDLGLRGIALDYTLPLASGSSFETGMKSTWVKTDNELVYTNNIDGVIAPNDDLSNHFIYRENINAAYASYAFSANKWNAQIGLRLEDSNIEGEQLTTDSSFIRNYLNFFPSGSFNFQVSQKHLVGISLSRRIDRPAYSQLNPFRFFVNTNTFRSGNPLLRPQYTWSGEINYTFMQRYVLSFNVAHSRDNLSSGIIRDGDRELVLITPLNIDKQWNYALMLSVPLNFTKAWTSQWNIHASYLDFDGLVNGYPFDRNTLIAYFNTNHNIELGKGYRFQFGGFVVPPHYISITRVRTLSSVNAGIQKTLLDGQARLSFNINDIFYDYYPKGYTDFGGIYDEWISYRDNQVATLSFSLQFGKMSVKPPARKRSSVQDELNRAAQNNRNGD